MAEFSPLKTGQLVIRFHAPWRRRVMVGLLAFALLLIPYLAYELGRWASGYSIVAITQERAEHAESVRKLEEQVAQLRSGVVSAELASNVDRQSYAAVEKTLADLQAEVRAQRDQLAFYQGIVSPREGSSGPRVQRLEVLSTAVEGRYVVKLLLIQSLLQDATVGGSLKFELVGTQDGRTSNLLMADLTSDERSRNGMSFSFKYFQELEQEIALPPGFTPTSINIELRGNRQAAQKQSFPWQPQTPISADTAPVSG